jgi:hypothetical protein
MAAMFAQAARCNISDVFISSWVSLFACVKRLDLQFISALVHLLPSHRFLDFSASGKLANDAEALDDLITDSVMTHLKPICMRRMNSLMHHGARSSFASAKAPA